MSKLQIHRRRVLFVIPSLQGGGAERVIVTLLRNIDRDKFSLALAVVDMHDAVYRSDVPEDVELIALNCSRVRYALPKIMWHIWQRRPDVVFSTLGHLNLGLAIVRPLLPERVCYIARESSIVSEVSRMNPYPWWGWAYRHFYGRYDKLVCQSRAMRDDLVNNFAFPAGKSVVIYNPVDVERIRRLASEQIETGMMQVDGSACGRVINLVAAGHMTPDKSFDLLIKAIALNANPQLKLTLLGDGPLRAELEQIAKDEGVVSQIFFTGFHKNPYPFFAQADVLVLSSRFEGFPNVVLEALTCGTPVIATPAKGGVSEILEGVPGCIVTDEVSTQSLAKAIAEFIPEGRLRPEVVAPYAVERIVSCYEKVLASCDI